MMTSLDGRVTGDFLFRDEARAATEIYYRLNRELRADGFICGRVTMEGSFTGGWYPELSQYEPLTDEDLEDHIVEGLSGFYAVSFDTHGSLGWKTSRIIDPDGDPGYDGAEIIEVLSEDVDRRYLAYLREIGISYIFAGKSAIDVELALYKLKTKLGCKCLLLEGGSIINGAFLRANAVDELSLVVAPVVADADGKPLFYSSTVTDFKLIEAKNENGNLILHYIKD
jgi:hypothetical protein